MHGIGNSAKLAVESEGRTGRAARLNDSWDKLYQGLDVAALQGNVLQIALSQAGSEVGRSGLQQRRLGCNLNTSEWARQSSFQRWHSWLSQL